MKKLLFAALLCTSLSAFAQEAHFEYLNFHLSAASKSTESFDKSDIMEQFRGMGVDISILNEMNQNNFKTQIEFLNFLGMHGFEVVSTYITAPIGNSNMPTVNYIMMHRRP